MSNVLTFLKIQNIYCNFTQSFLVPVYSIFMVANSKLENTWGFGGLSSRRAKFGEGRDFIGVYCCRVEMLNSLVTRVRCDTNITFQSWPGARDTNFIKDKGKANLTILFLFKIQTKTIDS